MSVGSKVSRRNTFTPFQDFRIDLVLRAEGVQVEAASLSAMRAYDAELTQEITRDLAERVAADLRFVVPHLDFDAVVRVAARRKVPSPYFRGQSQDEKTVVVRLPYTGHAGFLRCWHLARPDRLTQEFFLESGDLCFELIQERRTREEIDAEIDLKLTYLRQELLAIAGAVENYNSSIAKQVHWFVEAKKR